MSLLVILSPIAWIALSQKKIRSIAWFYTNLDTAYIMYTRSPTKEWKPITKTFHLSRIMDHPSYRSRSRWLDWTAWCCLFFVIYILCASAIYHRGSAPACTYHRLKVDEPIYKLSIHGVLCHLGRLCHVPSNTINEPWPYLWYQKHINDCQCLQ